jgi:hypothetical protein
MKKLILLILMLFLFSSGTLYAQGVQQENPTINEPAPDAPGEFRTSVQMDNLPSEVAQRLISPEFQEWTPLAAYLVREEDLEEYYAIEMQKGDERKMIALDSAGELIDRNLDQYTEESN